MPVMPRACAPDAEYILDGKFLLHRPCGRWMRPRPDEGGLRTYWCGSACLGGVVDAAPVETEVEFATLARAVVTLHPDLARRHHRDQDRLDWCEAPSAEVDAEELRRWQRCDLSDRRAMVRTAYVRVEIDEQGHVHRVRRGGQS